jgi:hypothetical protein
MKNATITEEKQFSEIKIKKRMTLPDRIQVSCSINYIAGHDPETQSEIYEYRQQTLQVLKNHSLIKTRRKEPELIYSSANQKKYLKRTVFYVEVPEEYYKEAYPEISHVRIRLENPFTVTVEFNFIKYLNQYLSGSGYYDTDNKPGQTLAGSNFIPSDGFDKLCGKTELIKKLLDGIPAVTRQFSDLTIRRFIPTFSRKYTTVTIKQIEFNVDYATPQNRAAEFQHKIQRYLTSYQGIDWLHGLGSFAASHYTTASYHDAGNPAPEELEAIGDLTCPTLKYFLRDGLAIKIYRKNYDLIRFEVTFHGKYIKKSSKYKDQLNRIHYTQKFESIIDDLFAQGNNFFNHAKFDTVIKTSLISSYNDTYAFLSDILEFTDLHYPELSILYDALINRTPIYDKRVIQYVKSYPQLYVSFYKQHAKNGQPMLLYKKHFKNQLQ